jgi:xanthine/uracil/vitamin C permease (AzgA family)
MAFRIKGDILWGISIATAAALLFGVTSLAVRRGRPPDFSTFFAPFQQVEGGIALLQIFTPALLVALFAIMLTDFFDTMGTVVAVGEQAGFVKPDGTVPGIRDISIVDSAAASGRRAFRCELDHDLHRVRSGVAEGGRTGLTPVVTGALFAAAAFFAPVVAMVGGGFTSFPTSSNSTLSMVGSGFQAPDGDFFVYPITAGALIIVGFLMMQDRSRDPVDRLRGSVSRIPDDRRHPAHLQHQLRHRLRIHQLRADQGAPRQGP